MVEIAFPHSIETEFFEGKNKKLLDFTFRHLCEGHPVILGVLAQGDAGHALLASGVEFDYGTGGLPEDEEDMPKPDKILALDPGGMRFRHSCIGTVLFIVIGNRAGGTPTRTSAASVKRKR